MEVLRYREHVRRESEQDSPDREQHPQLLTKLIIVIPDEGVKVERLWRGKQSPAETRLTRFSRVKIK